MTLEKLEEICGGDLIEELLTGRIFSKFLNKDRLRGPWPTIPTTFKSIREYEVIMDYLFQYEVYSRLVGREDKRSHVDMNERESDDEEENPQYWKATIGLNQPRKQRFAYLQTDVSSIREFTLVPRYTKNVDLKKVSVRKRDCLIITTKKINVKEKKVDKKK